MKIIWALTKRNFIKLMNEKAGFISALITSLIPMFFHFVLMRNINKNWLPGFDLTAEGRALLLGDYGIIAGSIVFIALYFPSSIFGFLPQDKENKTLANLLTAPIKRSYISLSYLLSALIVGFVFSFLALIVSQIYFVVIGGEFIGWTGFGTVSLLLLLITASFSCLLFFITSLLKTEQSAKAITGVLTAVIPLISGAYFSLAMLPDVARSIIASLPFVNAVTLLKIELAGPAFARMNSSFDTVALENMKENLGLHLIVNGDEASQLYMIIILVVYMVVFGALSVLRYRRYKAEAVL